MPGHTQSTESREFCIERDHFLGLMHEIVHDLRYHYPENRNQIIGRVYQLYVVLHRYQRLGHSLAESHSPSDIGHDVAHDFFTPQAQGHENFFDTVFGYACRSTQAQLNYTLYDLEYDRDPARIAQMLEELMETWQLIEVRVFPYHLPTVHLSRPALTLQTCGPSCPPSRARAANSNTPEVSPRSGRPVHPPRRRVRFLLPRTNTSPNRRARRRRYRPDSPYPGRGRGGHRRGSRSPALMDEQTLLTNGGAVGSSVSSLGDIWSVFGHGALSDGSVFDDALGITLPPPDDLPGRFEELAPAPLFSESWFNDSASEYDSDGAHEEEET
ncbi:hypothetical protein N7461_004223 [Penicillium sp. DV-2018c]|nr:hypothetical protein N7461_004223 [Penicillium sp. DV-2018c]